MTEYKQGNRKVVETVSIELKPLVGPYAHTYVDLTIENGELAAVEFGGIHLREHTIAVARAALKAADDEMARRKDRAA